MRVYCRPGATSLERLEAHVAFRLCSRPEASGQMAELLSSVIGPNRAPEAAPGQPFLSPIADPAEALGVARAVLLLCGLAPEHRVALTGNPREDFARLVKGCYRAPDPGSPETYALPSLLDAYCHMGAGFARGVDAVFATVTGSSLGDHLRRALALLERPADRTEVGETWGNLQGLRAS